MRQRRGNISQVNVNDDDDDDEIDDHRLTVIDLNQSRWFCGVVRFVVVSVCVFMGIVVYFLYTRMGLGAPFQGADLELESTLLPASSLEVVASLPTPPGNVAVSSDGRVFFNFHPEFSPKPTKVAVLTGESSWTPYPDAAFQEKLVTCLSLRVDQQNRLWLLDFAQHGIVGIPTLYGIDLSTNSLVHTFEFPSRMAGIGSMLNDFQVDPAGDLVYIADTSVLGGTPGLVLNPKSAHSVVTPPRASSVRRTRSCTTSRAVARTACCTRTRRSSAPRPSPGWRACP